VEKPLIVQSDRSILLEVDNASYHDARDRISRFAELEKSPEHVHFYRLTPLSIWNAASAGMTAEEMVSALGDFCRYEIPRNVERDIREYVRRYGLVRLERRGDEMLLTSEDPMILTEVSHNALTKQYLLGTADDGSLLMDAAYRGHVKQAMVKIGYPVEDLAGYVEGGHFPIELRKTTASGKPFELRPYQVDSADVFHAGGEARGGSGVIVLPCGAGKTVVGMGAMAELGSATLILVTNTVALRQWVAEIVDREVAIYPRFRTPRLNSLEIVREEPQDTVVFIYQTDNNTLGVQVTVWNDTDELVTDDITTSAPSTAAAGVAAIFAPASLTTRVLSSVRLYAVTLCPAPSRRRIFACPMLPTPI